MIQAISLSLSFTLLLSYNYNSIGLLLLLLTPLFSKKPTQDVAMSESELATFCILLAYPLYGFYLNPDLDNISRYLGIPLGYIALLTLTKQEEFNPLNLKWLSRTLALLTIVPTLFEISKFGWSHRGYGYLNDCTSLAFLAAATLLLIIARGKAELAKLDGLLIILLVGVIANTQSRGIMAGMAIVGIFMAIKCYKENFKLSKQWMAAIVGILAVIAITQAPRVIHMLEGTDNSSSSRIAILTKSIDMIKTQPTLLGNGIGTWSKEYKRNKPAKDVDSNGLSAHNDYLELAYEYGFSYAILLLATLVWLIHYTYFKTKLTPNLCFNLLGMLGLIMSALNFIITRNTGLAVLVVLGLVLSRPKPEYTQPLQIMPLLLGIGVILAVLMIAYEGSVGMAIQYLGVRLQLLKMF